MKALELSVAQRDRWRKIPITLIDLGRARTARVCRRELTGGAKEKGLSQACQRLADQSQDVLLLLRR